MKTCTKCNTSYPVGSGFYKNRRRPDGYADACKVCADAMSRASRKANPNKYQELHRAQRDKNKSTFLEWKSKQKCLLCPENCSACLDLHHLDPTQKDITISEACQVWSWVRLQTELAKCVVLCRNCHAKVHAGVVQMPV